MSTSDTYSTPGFVPQREIEARGFFAESRMTSLILWTLSFWESREAVKAFAGDPIEKALYFPEDEKYLLEFESTVHCEVLE